ncbi:hypothetical protein LXL04_035447 [Taraxacum kok-saghyz]
METVPTSEKKPHVIFIPLPAQSHVKAMLKLAQLLHHKGLQITFINTDFIHNRLLKSGGVHSLDGSDGFQFASFPDGIPRTSEDDEGTHLLFHYLYTHFSTPFLDLATNLPTPPTLIISDGFMSVFTIDAAKKLGIPIMLYWTFSACSFMGFYQAHSLMEKGIIPLKDESYLTNGYLDTIIDWIPGMEGIQLKYFPSNVWTTNPDDIIFKLCIDVTQNAHNVSYNFIHTFDALETSLVNALSSMIPHVYTVGPMQLLLNQVPAGEEAGKAENSKVNVYSLWKEEAECLKWLESKEPKSVIYVNYGSTTIMSLQDLVQFGCGLANSNHYFLWIIRSGVIAGESAVFPPELEDSIKKRGFIASWCPQEKVLDHPSIGGFLTHCGWGSMIESLSAGVPMICWPYLWDQITNCRFACKEWEVGLEMGKEVKMEEVSKLVKELMGEEGRKIRAKALEWKEKARAATAPDGSSFKNVDKIVEEIVMLSRK